MQAQLGVRMAKPLGMWLNDTVEHEGKTFASIHKDFAEVLSEAAGGDVDIWDFVAAVPADKLTELIAASKKKKPVQKKLYTRLHYELRYVLTAEQAALIKVEPHGAPIPEGDPATAGK